MIKEKKLLGSQESISQDILPWSVKLLGFCSRESVSKVIGFCLLNNFIKELFLRQTHAVFMSTKVSVYDIDFSGQKKAWRFLREICFW